MSFADDQSFESFDADESLLVSPNVSRSQQARDDDGNGSGSSNGYNNDRHQFARGEAHYEYDNNNDSLETSTSTSSSITVAAAGGADESSFFAQEDTIALGKNTGREVFLRKEKTPDGRGFS
mmetsp:Transcript_4918/g.8482  ORF Transcript_4918/g.8482 Transcript_4918/m.8482 type:complete len:122 (+) Transcript_4918:130-495(+)